MYLERRSNLKLLVLLADSRREPLAADAGVLEYAEDKEDRLYKILLVATKVETLSWFSVSTVLAEYLTLIAVDGIRLVCWFCWPIFGQASGFACCEASDFASPLVLEMQ